MRKFIVEFQNVKNEWFRSVAVPGRYKTRKAANKAINERGHPGIDYRVCIYHKPVLTLAILRKLRNQLVNADILRKKKFLTAEDIRATTR